MSMSKFWNLHSVLDIRTEDVYCTHVKPYSLHYFSFKKDLHLTIFDACNIKNYRYSVRFWRTAISGGK